jgi:hypothetical protein
VRGTKEEIGAERISPNGYTYVKVERDGKEQWILKHWLVAEKARGGDPIDSSVERVAFKDGNKSNLKPDNIVVTPKGKGSARRRIAQIEARIAELTAERDHLKHELEHGGL